MRFAGVVRWLGTSAPVMGLLAAALWIAMALVGAACFSSLTQRSRASFATDEILSYAAAFAVAGTLSGAVALAMRGRWKLATVSLVWLLLLLAGAAALLLYYPTEPWLFSGYALSDAYKRVAAALAMGLRIGVPGGLLVAACVVALEPLLRRGRRWALGVVLALGVVVATGWGINHAVMWIARLGLGERRGIRREVVWGAACGAIVGALVAALMAAIIAWAVTRKRSRVELRASARSQAGPTTVGRGP